MAVYKSDGKMAAVPKTGGDIIPVGSDEYITAVSKILHQNPDVKTEQVTTYCNVYKGYEGTKENIVYYALPKSIIEPEESTQTSSGGTDDGGDENTETE